MIKEAIILAGGLGTRLRSAVPDLPKCMAPVAGRPFLAYVIDHLRMQGIEHFIFSLGYMSDSIENFISEQYPTLHYTVALEKEPLGTGGAIALSLSNAKTNDVIITNGDTLFKVNIADLENIHIKHQSVCTLALKQMHDFDRYGVVDLNEDGRVVSFREKKQYPEGLINGGTYLLNKKAFLKHSWPAKFSFENHYLEKYYSSESFYGSIQKDYFIDIGIPADYEKAQFDLKRVLFDLKAIDNTWTLFLDRDGVINEEKKGHYILNWDEFRFTENALRSFPIFKKIFKRIIIVSNQRGIGKGLMTHSDLLQIHDKMRSSIESEGGRIDAIYYCSDIDDKHSHRKPNPGMALQATIDFADINLAKSIMVGNKPSDMRFGRAAGMHTIFVRTTNPDQEFPHPDIDLVFTNLSEFAKTLHNNVNPK